MLQLNVMQRNNISTNTDSTKFKSILQNYLWNDRNYE
jgi:hypothetical protein